MNEGEQQAIISSFEAVKDVIYRQQEQIRILQHQVKELAIKCNARDIMLEIEKEL